MVHLGKIFVYVIDDNAPTPSESVSATFKFAPPFTPEHFLTDHPAPRIGGGFGLPAVPLTGWSAPVSLQDDAPETVPQASLLHSLISAAPPSGRLGHWQQKLEGFRVGFVEAPSGPTLECDFEELPDLPELNEADADSSTDADPPDETVEVKLVRPSSPPYMAPVFEGFLKTHARSGWGIGDRPKRGLAGLLTGVLAILPPAAHERIGHQHLPSTAASSTAIQAGPPPYLDAEGLPCPIPTEPCDSRRSYPEPAPSLTSERMSFDHACTYLEQPCPDGDPLQRVPASLEPLSPVLKLGWWLIEQPPVAQIKGDCHAD